MLAPLRLARYRSAPLRLVPLRLANPRVGPFQGDPVQISPTQISLAQVGIAQVGIAQVGPAQVGPGQACTFKFVDYVLYLLPREISHTLTIHPLPAGQSSVHPITLAPSKNHLNILRLQLVPPPSLGKSQLQGFVLRCQDGWWWSNIRSKGAAGGH